MDYTIKLSTSEVIRNSDGKVIAPCQSGDDPDWQAYLAWVYAGNTPIEVE